MTKLKLTVALTFALSLLTALPTYAGHLRSFDSWHRHDSNWGKNSNYKGESDPSTVPEPSSFAMLGAGLLLLGGVAAFRHTRVASNE